MNARMIAHDLKFEVQATDGDLLQFAALCFVLVAIGLLALWWMDR